MAKEDSSMALLKTWIEQKQRWRRINGLHAVLMRKVLLIQRAYRSHLAKKKTQVKLVKVSNLQRLLKGIHTRMIVRKQLAAIPVLQRSLPMLIAQYRFRKYRNGIVKV